MSVHIISRSLTMPVFSSLTRRVTLTKALVVLVVVLLVFVSLDEGEGQVVLHRECSNKKIPPLVFIKPHYKDSLIVSNMLYYIALKNNIQIALNTEHPTHWYLWITSELLQPDITPGIMAAEQQYDKDRLQTIMPNDSLVIGYLKYPIDMFITCLQKKVLEAKNKRDSKYGISLDANINMFLDQFDGNKRSYNEVQPESCINELSMTLGLTDDVFSQAESDAEVVGQFVDKVLQNVDHFIIEERLVESLYLLGYKHCLELTDLMLLQKIPATFEGAGFGGVSDDTRERLEVFLKFDMLLYRTVNDRMVEDMNSVHHSSSKVEFEQYKARLATFEEHCVMTSKLSSDNVEYRARQHPLTEQGEEDVRCRVLQMSFPFLSNLLLEIQDQGLKEYVSSLISTGEKYTDFLTLLTNAIDNLE